MRIPPCGMYASYNSWFKTAKKTEVFEKVDMLPEYVHLLVARYKYVDAFESLFIGKWLTELPDAIDSITGKSGYR